MSSGFEGAGWVWRFIGGDEAPGMWHHTDNAEHVELIRRRTVCEVRELAFADDVRQLDEQRAELLRALQCHAKAWRGMADQASKKDSFHRGQADACKRHAAQIEGLIANATQQRKEQAA